MTQQNEVLFGVYDLTKSPIYILKRLDFKVIYANNAAARLVGYARDERFSFFDLFKNEDLKKIEDMFEEGLDLGVFAAFDLKLISKSGRVLNVDLFGNILKQEQSNYIMMSIHYLSALEKLTEKLEAEAKSVTAINSSKAKSLSEMASGAAHEINNPLAIIQGHLDLLKRHLEDGKLDSNSIVKRLSIIEDNSVRIGQVIKALRLFAREENSDISVKVDLDKIIQNVLDLTQERFKKHNVELKIVHPPKNTVIECRESQISRLLFNLMINSFEAVISATESWVKVTFEVFPSKIRIQVVDSGPGIPKEIQDKIFIPFFSTKSTGESMGLGLSVAQGIVRSHLGEIRLDTTQSNTCFIIELPIPKVS